MVSVIVFVVWLGDVTEFMIMWVMLVMDDFKSYMTTSVKVLEDG